MISSSNGTSQFPQFSPYLNLNPSTPSSFCLNDNQPLLYNHQDLLSYCLIETANKMTEVSTKETTLITNPQIPNPDGDHCGRPPPLRTQCRPRKQPAKRDRHSKIFTAQGSRDRRVRLSIDIARKFFGLQDLLGYDKASLTLDWLITKSKTAIKELVHSKDIDDANAKFLCSFLEDQCVVTGTTEEADNGDSKKTSCSTRKRKPAKQKGAKNPKIAALDKQAKESRAKARERARERTREKSSLLLRKLNEDQKLPDLIPLSPKNQSRLTWRQTGTCKSSESSRQSTMSSLKLNGPQVDEFFFVNPWTGEVNNEEMFEESIKIKRKTNSTCSNLGFQRNLIASEKSSSNFNNWQPVTDKISGISTSMTCSSLCAVTNGSSSKVLQICGKPWEEQINNCKFNVESMLID